MHISSIAVVISVAAGSALALPALTQSAFAVQDQPTTIGGIETVCTGVGSAKDNPAWGSYPVKLVFANPKGEDLAQEHISVMQGGKSVVETDCDAPWVLMKLPAGQYSVAASIGARTGNASFTTSGSGQKTVTVTMPPANAAASGQ
jgi:PKD repeat protein